MYAGRACNLLYIPPLSSQALEEFYVMVQRESGARLTHCRSVHWKRDFFQCLAMSISTTSIHFNPLQFLHKFAHVAGIKKLIHPVLWSLKHFETCWNSLRPDRVCYGPKQVFEAIEKCAVQTLMVSGPIFLSLGTPKWDGPS